MTLHYYMYYAPRFLWTRQSIEWGIKIIDDSNWIICSGLSRLCHLFLLSSDPALANVFENGLALGLLLLADVSALAPGRPRLLEDSSITDASDPPIRRTAVYVSFRNRAEVARTQNEVERLKISI